MPSFPYASGVPPLEFSGLNCIHRISIHQCSSSFQFSRAGIEREEKNCIDSYNYVSYFGSTISELTKSLISTFRKTMCKLVIFRFLRTRKFEKYEKFQFLILLHVSTLDQNQKFSSLEKSPGIEFSFVNNVRKYLARFYVV